MAATLSLAMGDERKPIPQAVATIRGEAPGTTAEANAPAPANVAPPGVTKQFHSEHAVGLATFFGSFIAGAIVLALNYRLLKRPVAALITLVAALMFAGFAVAVALANPGETGTMMGLIGFVIVLIMMGLARVLQRDHHRAHVAAGGRTASNWIGTGIGAAFSVPIIVLAFTTTPGAPPERELDLGTEVSFGHDRYVYYRGETTEADARRLGAALREAEYFNDLGPAYALLQDRSNTFEIALIGDGSALEQTGLIPELHLLAATVARVAFADRPIYLRIVDLRLNPLVEVKSRPDLAYVVGDEDGIEVFHSTSIEVSTAEAFAEFLGRQGHETITATLHKDGGTHVASFVVEAGAGSDDQVRESYRALVKRASAELFDGAPVTVELLYDTFELQARLPAP